jgi:hypothetical protein
VDIGVCGSPASGAGGIVGGVGAVGGVGCGGVGGVGVVGCGGDVVVDGCATAVAALRSVRTHASCFIVPSRRQPGDGK